MRINVRYGVAVGIAAAASHYPGIGGTALRSNHRCDWDDRWCHDYDDFDHFHHGGYHHFGHFHHGDFDRFR
jgi:hypothetical protein